MDRCAGATAGLPGSDRGDLAVQVLARSAPISDLAIRHGVSRKFVYQQTHKARVAMDGALRSATPENEMLFELVVTKGWLSRHPARATERRLSPSVRNWSSSCCQLARFPTSVTCPFAPRALPRFITTPGQSAPGRRIGTFWPRGFGRLRLFPWHRRPSSQVPCKSPNEGHASYTPDTVWPVGRFPPYSSRSKVRPGFDVTYSFRYSIRSSLALVSLIHS
jgi:hypothetical protein